MSMTTEPLDRIADALERLAPTPAPEADARQGVFFRWDGARLLAAAGGQTLPLDRFVGVDHQKAALAHDPDRFLAEADQQRDTIGSNNWVIAASRTATGRPILANDPHREHSVPSLRYIVGLNAPGISVIAVSATSTG